MENLQRAMYDCENEVLNSVRYKLTRTELMQLIEHLNTYTTSVYNYGYEKGKEWGATG